VLVDRRAAALEKFVQLWRVTGSVVFAIQFEPNAAAPGKVAGEIVEKKFPFRRAPKVGLFVIVKTNHESGHEIELFSEIGKGNEGMNTPDHAWYT
jgi:hypothetical protein